MFYGNRDAFNATVTIKAGSSKIEPKLVLAQDMVLYWKTLSDAADDAGWSRRWGGIYFYSGDQHGRALGGLVGYNQTSRNRQSLGGLVYPQPREPAGGSHEPPSRWPADPVGSR